MYSLILLSGGTGDRMRKKTPKQYLLLGGKPIIIHSLEKISEVAEIGEVVIVCRAGYEDYIKQLIEQYRIAGNFKFAQAGDSRQESVYNGLNLISNSSVIIHEAARPLVTCEDFKMLIENQNDNVIYGYPLNFTVAKAREKFEGILNRNEIINVQLPQKFDTDLIKRAHEWAKNGGKRFTDDSSLVYAYSGAEIEVIKGSSINIKITEPADLLIGEVLYKEYILGRR